MMYSCVCVENHLSDFQADCEKARVYHEGVTLNYNGDDDKVRLGDLHATLSRASTATLLSMTDSLILLATKIFKSLHSLSAQLVALMKACQPVRQQKSNANICNTAV